MIEKDFEDIICQYPELIEEGLILMGRQVTLLGRRMDILFTDKFRRKLIVELKAGPIKDSHIGQILAYEGMLLTADDPTLRVMLVGTRVPPNFQKSLDHHGIAWKEITVSFLKEFLKAKRDESFSHLFEEEVVIPTFFKSKKNNELLIHKTNEHTNDQRVDPEVFADRLKNSDYYQSFKTILEQKKGNEEKARMILEENLGRLNHKHLKEILILVDEPYPYIYQGKTNNRPWFGNLLNTPNTQHLLSEDIEKINQWFSILTNEKLLIDRRFNILLGEPYKINGLKSGFITLILYVLDKANNQVWFSRLHRGLKLVYPYLDDFKPIGPQYLLFNKAAKQFAKQFNFEHTELDWIFSVGLPEILIQK